MFKLIKLGLACGLVGTVIGCDNKGTSTAPTTKTTTSGGTTTSSTTTAKLTVKVGASHTVTQDRTDEVSVSVDRDNFNSPVTISMDNLPKGVTVETKDLTIPADKTSVVVTLKAAADAPPVVDHMVKVMAKAKDAKPELPDASTELKLTVKSK